MIPYQRLVSITCVLCCCVAVWAQREKGPGQQHVVQRRRGSVEFPSLSTQSQYRHHSWAGAGAYPAPYPQLPGVGGGPHAVLPPPRPLPQPYPPTNVLIQPEKVVLNCLVHGYTPERIQWLRPAGPGLVADGSLVLWEPLHISVQASAASGAARQSRLVINYPRPHHLGTWLCRAGRAGSDIFTVGGATGVGWQPVYLGQGRNSDAQPIEAGGGPATAEVQGDVLNEGVQYAENEDNEDRLLKQIAQEIEHAERTHTA